MTAGWNKIIGAMVIYNAVEFLELSLRSLLCIADEIVVVDGPYINYPHKTSYSDDGSLDIVEKYQKLGAPITLIKKNSPWSDQMAKRNEYLNRAKTGDLVFILDGDCQPIAMDEAMQRLRTSNADGFQATDVKPDGCGGCIKIPWSNPYIIRKTEGMHYALNHYSIYDAQGRHVYLPPYRLETLYDSLYVVHHGEQRSAQKIIDNDAYYSTRVEYADGHEVFKCAKCKQVVKLKHGERMLCPFCGHWELQTDLKYEKPHKNEEVDEKVNT